MLALKFLGFSLDEIKAVLAAPPVGLRETLDQQSAMLRQRREQLDAVITAVERAQRLIDSDDCDWDAVASVIRAIQMNQSTEWA